MATNAQKAQAAILQRSVYLEMSAIVRSPLARESVTGCVVEYALTNNSTFLDLAVHFCNTHDITLPPTLIHLVKEQTARRLTDLASAGSPHKILKSMQTRRALQLMAGLRAVGASLATAASKASRFLFDTQPKYADKPGTLERKYVEEYRKRFEDGTTIETMLAERLALPKHRKNRRMWSVLLAVLPDCTEDQAGSGRR